MFELCDIWRNALNSSSAHLSILPQYALQCRLSDHFIHRKLGICMTCITLYIVAPWQTSLPVSIFYTMYGPYGNRNVKGKTMPAERYCFSWVYPLLPMDNWNKCKWTYWWSIKLVNRIEFRYVCVIMHRMKQNGRYYHLGMIWPYVMCWKANNYRVKHLYDCWSLM